MKKAAAILLLTALALCLCSCGEKKERDLLEEIRKKGYIEFVTEPYWAPNEFIDPTKTGDEQFVGTDIELARYIADTIGVDLKIIPLEFAAVLTSITEGKYDMAISAIAWSPEREQAMAMSDGYEFDDEGFGFVTRAGEEGRYRGIEDLKDAVVITQSGSVQEAIYNQYCSNAKEFKLVGSMTDAYLAVSEGKADVCITAIGSGRLYAEANGGIAVADFKFDADKKMSSTCVCLPLEGSASLMEVVNRCIAELIARDKFAEWSAYYEEYARQLGIE